MPLRTAAAAAALLILLFAGSARAGLYNTAEMHDEVYSTDFRVFSDTIVKLQRFYNPKMDSPHRKRAQLATAFLPEHLRALRPDPGFTADHFLNLSAYLIRLGKQTEAIDLLENAKERHPDNFLYYANLGTAYQQTGLDQRALAFLELCLKRWPARFNDLSPEQQKYFGSVFARELSFEHYRRAEEFNLELLKLRLRTKPGGDKTLGVVHLLFAGKGQPVRFVGEGGSFTPGKIAAAERQKLPPSAIETVQQLLIWSPQSPELYWLLGELYNARGDLKAADTLFKLAVDTGERSPEFLEHRRILQAYINAQTGQDKADDKSKATKDDDGAWNSNPWFMFGLGFAAGAVVLLLAGLQLRLLARRRGARSSRDRAPAWQGGSARHEDASFTAEKHEGTLSVTTVTADKPAGDVQPKPTDAHHHS